MEPFVAEAADNIPPWKEKSATAMETLHESRQGTVTESSKKESHC